MMPQPRLPSVYRLVTVDRPEEVLDRARALAIDGAEDGTLVWARPPEPGAPPIDFTGALILEPECPWGQAQQLMYVAMLGLHDALGSLLPPGGEVMYLWPNTLVFNGARFGEVRLEAKRGAARPESGVDWLVLWATVHVARREREELVHSTSLHDEGCEHISLAEMLEGFARYFLNWANRWQDDGFAPVRSLWLTWTESVGETVSVPAVAGSEARGTFVDLDEDGRLVLEVDGERRSIALDDTPCVTRVAG